MTLRTRCHSALFGWLLLAIGAFGCVVEAEHHALVALAVRVGLALGL